MIPRRKATFFTRIPPSGGTPVGSANADEVFRFACGLAPGCHAEALPDPSVSALLTSPPGCFGFPSTRVSSRTPQSTHKSLRSVALRDLECKGYHAEWL